MNMSIDGVIVWEFENEHYSSFFTFEPLDCHKIEVAFQNYLNNKSSQNEEKVIGNKCIINFKHMEKTDCRTNITGKIRRNQFSNKSAAAKQIRWEWNAENNKNPFWLQYPADVNEYIECSYQSDNNGLVDLFPKFPNFDYTLDFSCRLQTNNNTQYPRSIQRIFLPDKYPRISSASSLDNVVDLTSSASRTSSINDTPSTSSTDLGQNGVNGGGPVAKPRSILSKLPVIPELGKFAKAVTLLPDESCSICLGALTELSGFSDKTSGSHSQYATVIELKQCKHVFHSECLQAAVKNDQKKSSLTCPTCKTIYGVKEGNQPEGTMTHRFQSHPSLPGHPGCGMIVITYNFRSGTQGPGMPNPGQPYYAQSFPRTAYLPDNPEGRKVLHLLEVAWKRRLIFTISRSVTTGRDNAITWNEIHHKTEATTNYSGHGYPDPNYLMNVTEELKLQGVTEADIQ